MADAPVTDVPADSGRYARQVRYPGIGAAGQERLGAAVVTVVGCGALGSASVNMLARAGIGEIRIIDRDVVELSNLQRQVLFEERDAEAGVAQGGRCRRRGCRRINSTVRALPIVADLTPANVLELLAGSSVVIDGTDNLETRLLLNDACMRMGLPWVYGGVVGSTGWRWPSSRGAPPASAACIPHAPSVTGSRPARRPASSPPSWPRSRRSSGHRPSS